MAGVADELYEAQEESHRGSGHAAEGDDQSEPAAIGVRAVAGDSAEDREHERSGDSSYEEDGCAGREELTGVWLHRGSG